VWFVEGRDNMWLDTVAHSRVGLIVSISIQVLERYDFDIQQSSNLLQEMDGVVINGPGAGYPPENIAQESLRIYAEFGIDQRSLLPESVPEEERHHSHLLFEGPRAQYVMALNGLFLGYARYQRDEADSLGKGYPTIHDVASKQHIDAASDTVFKTVKLLKSDRVPAQVKDMQQQR